MQNHPYKGRAALVTLLVAAFSAESTDAAPRPRLDHVSGDDPSAVVLAASATSTNHHHRHVPPMYSPGTDGVWRRRESYTLVGSTICDTCTTTPTPTVTLSDDAVKENARTLGWVHEGVSSPTRTRVTIALSVTLAVFIFLTILRFHYSWRCKRRKVDVEKRRHRKSRGGDVNPPQKGEEPVAQTKRKWMARATARWRDNARLLARKRRFSRRAGARGSQETLVSNSNSNSNSNINNNEEETETHPPHPLPRRQSRHYDAAGVPRPGSPAPSLCSLASTSTTTLEYAPGDDEEQPGHPPEQEPEQEYEPPAYPVTPPAHASTSRAPVIAISLSPPPPHPHPPPADRKQMLSLGQLCADTDAHAEDFPPYTPRAEPDSAEGYFGEREGAEGAAVVAHVATDDKAVLARLAGRASAPSLRATTATTATASSSSTSAYTSSIDADGDAEDARARAPEEEELFEVQLQEIRVREAGAAPTTVPAHVWTTLPRPSSSSSVAITPPSRMPTTSATLPALPPPPPRRASGSEKMALERAYVHADEEVYAYPSAPAYSRRYSGDADAEAGPSTPRASVVASAPPLEWDEDGEDDDCVEEGAASAPPLEFWEEEEDEEGGEDRLPGPVPEFGDLEDAGSHAGRRSDDQGGLGVERQRQRQRERERERNRHGEVHDTGWGGGGGGGSSADAGQGQDHDR